MHSVFIYLFQKVLSVGIRGKAKQAFVQVIFLQSVRDSCR